MKIGTWLLAMMQPLIAKVLVSLGFSVVTITGLTAITNDLKAQAISGIGSLPPELLNLFLLSGGSTALGIILGALTTKLMLWAITDATRLLGTNPQ